MNIFGIANELNVLDNLQYYREELIKIEVNVSTILGTAVPLDTVTVRFILCEMDKEDTIYIDKVGVNIGDNVSQIKISSDETKLLIQNKYKYIIELIYNTGDKNVGKGTLLLQ